MAMDMMKKVPVREQDPQVRAHKQTDRSNSFVRITEKASGLLRFFFLQAD